MTGFSAVRKVTEAEVAKLGFRDDSLSSMQKKLMRCPEQKCDSGRDALLTN